MDKSKIKRLADYAVRQCRDNSDNCYWTISYDELYYHFGAEVSDTNENGRLLEKNYGKEGGDHRGQHAGYHLRRLCTKQQLRRNAFQGTRQPHGYEWICQPE